MLFRMPIAITLTTMLDPPELTRGRVRPVMGIRPSVMPTLTITWTANIAIIPTDASLANGSVLCHAISMPHQTMTP